MMSQMKALEEENRRLKRMYADLSMQADLLKEALGKSDPAFSVPGVGRESCGATKGERAFVLPGIWCERDLLSLQPEAG